MADDDQQQQQQQGDDAGGENYDDYVEEEAARVCKVYDKEDFFTVFVQMLLALFALLSLWFKRQNERPRRKFRTWFLDISKQGLGACYAHVCNMVCVGNAMQLVSATVVASRPRTLITYFRL